MTISRSAFSRLDRVLAARGYVAAQIAIVGTNRVALEFADSVERESHGSLRVMGLISRRPNHDSVANRQILGHIDEIESIYKRIHFDKLVLATPQAGESFKERRGGTVISLLNFCEQNGVALYMVPDSFEIAVAPSEVASFSGTPLVRLQDTALHPVYEVVKRVMDVVFSCAILLIGLPLWLAIAVGLKLTSSGPILFSQLRAGHNGRPFRMYKFRSMSVDAESRLGQLVDLDALQEPVFKIKNDPRVTALGRWLRRSGLDEIPQLINVLRGEMSLVGPRPEEIALVHKYDQWQRRRLKAKPGITGYQQIKNRGGSSLAERIGYDLVYLKHQSLGLDLYIMLHTPLVLLRGSGVSH
jgi:exopolysaccharide biosynthesis polyprenyl glycosylphosphotransferase